jgi:hypothetical protein
MANGKPWYRINLNLRKRLREFKRRQRERREKALRDGMSLHDLIPDEATGVLLGLRNGAKTDPAHKYKK